LLLFDCLSRRLWFFKCGGFEGFYNLASGDDDMFIHRMAKIKGTKFAYNWEASAVMPTAPVDSWMALLQQRTRCGSNGAKYKSKANSAFHNCRATLDVWIVQMEMNYYIRAMGGIYEV